MQRFWIIILVYTHISNILHEIVIHERDSIKIELKAQAGGCLLAASHPGPGGHYYTHQYKSIYIYIDVHTNKYSIHLYIYLYLSFFGVVDGRQQPAFNHADTTCPMPVPIGSPFFFILLLIYLFLSFFLSFDVSLLEGQGGRGGCCAEQLRRRPFTSIAIGSEIALDWNKLDGDSIS